MYFKFRTRILTRTLDIPRPWRRQEVRNSQLYTWRKMRFHHHTDGGWIQRNRSPSIQEYQCFESWNCGKKEWQRHHTLQCGCFEHRTPIANDSLNKSAQHLRTSCLLEWRVWSEVWWNFRKTSEDRNENIMKEVRPQEVNSLVQTPRSDDPVSGNRLRECIQNFATLEIYKSLRRCDIPEKSLYWKFA